MADPRDEISGRRVLVAIAAIAVVVGLAVAASQAIVRWTDTPPGAANAPMDIAIPPPLLQSAPQGENRALSDAQRKRAAPAGLPPEPSILQKPGAGLPLGVHFADSSDHRVALADVLSSRPVVLVFGYYRCPDLCTTLMENVLFSAGLMSLDPSAYRLVEIGIDPRETAADARVKLAAYRTRYPAQAIELLTAAGDASREVAQAAGIRYAYDGEHDRYSHPLAVLVVAPDGRVSRYFAGISPEPRALELALVEAGEGEVGTVTDRIFLRCAHFDPRTGRYSVAAVTFVRAGVVVVVLVLAVAMMVRVRRSRR